MKWSSEDLPERQHCLAALIHVYVHSGLAISRHYRGSLSQINPCRDFNLIERELAAAKARIEILERDNRDLGSRHRTDAGFTLSGHIKNVAIRPT